MNLFTLIVIPDVIRNPLVLEYRLQSVRFRREQQFSQMGAALVSDSSDEGWSAYGYSLI